MTTQITQSIVTPDGTAPVNTAPAADGTAVDNTATSHGVAETPDTIQGVQADAPTTVQSRGFCAQLNAFLRDIADGIASFFSSIFSTIKSLFVKAETQAQATIPTEKPTTASTTASTTTLTAVPLEAFKTVAATLEKDEVVRAFGLLNGDVQELIKGEMWRLAGEDIVDSNHPGLNERQPAEDWAGRVIRNEIQIQGEDVPRADIQRYVDITAENSLLRRAIDSVILSSPVVNQ